MRSCRDCGAPIPSSTGRGRPRVLCVQCSPPVKRVTVAPSAPTVSEIRPGACEEVGLVEATRRRLRDHGLMSDPAALSLLELARSIARGEDHPGASLASLVKEFRAGLEAIAPPATADAADDDGMDWGVG